MDIRELDITKEMYLGAKKVEVAWEMSEQNEYFDDIYTKKDKDFRKKYGDYFNTWEIVQEYERRETNTDKLLSKNQNVYEITYTGDTTKEFKFFSCDYDKISKKLYMLRSDIYGNVYPAVIDAKNIKKVDCIIRNNNLDYQ